MIPLYVGPSRANPPPESTAAASGMGETRQVDYDWSLIELGLPVGTALTMPRRGDRLSAPLDGSEPRRLSIVTPEELADRLAARQAALLAELAQLLAIQRRAGKRSMAIEVQAREVGRLRQPDMDRLRGAEVNQRQVSQTLTSKTDGVPRHIAALLADLTNNKIDSPRRAAADAGGAYRDPVGLPRASWP